MRYLLAAALASVLACGGAVPHAGPTASGAVDCGSFDAGHGTYDAAGTDCFWRAYTGSVPARWSVTMLTVEGDPIPATITFAPGQPIVVTRDVTADAFSSATDRRVWTFRCATIERKPWATDPSRSFFELSVCTGDGATTAFP
jgi:hypothetical protein